MAPEVPPPGASPPPFFTRHPRLARYRERISEQVGVPLETLNRNHATAIRLVEAGLAKFPPAAG